MREIFLLRYLKKTGVKFWTEKSENSFHWKTPLEKEWGMLISYYIFVLKRSILITESGKWLGII